MTDEIACPVDDCDAGPWPDTYGADGGRRKRFLHVYTHGAGRYTTPFNRIDRL